MNKIRFITTIILAAVLLVVDIGFAVWVVREDDSVYIVDRTGERWDVSQAQTVGFNPHRFQYGLGKNAFTPLRDEDFEDDRVSSFFNTRIIGISIDGKAHAYTVDRLKHHETANTTIAGKAIVAGY
ncbi:MAG: DUF3179 domain-containing protein [Desulforhopalus sp.]|nr:DUF3179 domain-containing protein [Desulforhopalus sp.]